MSFSFLLRPDDEFEDEPEDELASAGMHMTEGDAADDDEEAKPGEDDVELDDEVVIPAADEEEDKPASAEDIDDAPDGLEELEELEKGVLGDGLTFGEPDEE